jgi:hypothetical protein
MKLESVMHKASNNDIHTAVKYFLSKFNPPLFEKSGNLVNENVEILIDDLDMDLREYYGALRK